MKLQNNYYVTFWLFGLINNVLYVVILSAAMDLVGPKTPKSLILLVDILPSLLVKMICPFIIHRINYGYRVISLMVMSIVGMLIVSIHRSLRWSLFGICLASISSGFGEVTFLQLTRISGIYITEDSNKRGDALNGWSSGTGGAGLIGSLLYFILTSLFHFSISGSLLLFTLLPWGLLIFFKLDMDRLLVSSSLSYSTAPSPEQIPSMSSGLITEYGNDGGNLEYKNTFRVTIKRLIHLVVPYMLPLTSVYFFEYLINQSVAPTLLFPKETLPFQKNRDLYVLYGTLYQVGVFISRSSGKLVRLRCLYILSHLQCLNFTLAILQSWTFINNKYPLLNMILILWEGLLGGSSYVNTFLNIQEDLSTSEVEFAMGSVSIADSLGVFLASIVGLFLEPTLCKHQIKDGRPWCGLE